ncbi:zinc ABC transporter substrate-binding protein, partial [Arcobacteraceae bacterium]|nr:zinc ABC transporter substrate-binding protein [Arcobacteraceae bacterium]
YLVMILIVMSNLVYAKTNVIVSILPQQTFVEKIGGDKVEVTTMVRPGSDPHTYEPRPSQMTAITKADIYFPIGIEFEEAWLHKFKAQNENMQFVQMTTGLNYMKIAQHAHHHGEHGDESAPFEWAGLFSLKKGIYTWSFSKLDSKYADEKMKMLILETKHNDSEGIESIEKNAISIFEKDNSSDIRDLATLTPSSTLYNITFNEQKNMTKVTIDIKKDGNYVFFTEHMPFEFEKDEHFFKDLSKNDVEPLASEPESDGHDHHSSKDPHVWTSPANVNMIAKNIYTTLSKQDPKNKEYFKKNYIQFLKEISKTDFKIREILSDLDAGSKFMVFHPSWGYFASDYSLTQLVIEVEGKEPKPKALKEIISKAREENIKVIFAQKEFSDKSSKAIAQELNIKVIKETPLAKNWSENLIEMAKAIANHK